MFFLVEPCKNVINSSQCSTIYELLFGQDKIQPNKQLTLLTYSNLWRGINWNKTWM